MIFRNLTSSQVYLIIETLSNFKKVRKNNIHGEHVVTVIGSSDLNGDLDLDSVILKIETDKSETQLEKAEARRVVQIVDLMVSLFPDNVKQFYSESLQRISSALRTSYFNNYKEKALP